MLLSLKFSIVFVVVLQVSQLALATRDLFGYSLFRLKPQNEQQLNYLKYLAQTLDFENSPLDFWRLSSGVNDTSEVMLSPVIRNELLKQISAVGMTPRRLMSDIGR